MSKLSRRLRNRRGLTLVELLISMTILGVVSAIVAAVMLGQQRVFQQTYEMVGVRRELRTAMSLVPTDVRGLSSVGGDVSNFTENALTFRSTIGASVVCDRSGASRIFLPPLNLANNTLTSWVSRPIPGDTVFAFDEGPLRGAEDDSWVALTVSSVTPVLTACATSPFLDAVADVGKVRWAIDVAEAIPATVLIGAGVRFTRHVEYALQESPTSGRWYLTLQSRRGGAWETPLVVSGPYEVPADGGLRLVYFDSTGTEVLPGSPSNTLARVDLTMRAKGLPSSRALYEGGDAIPRDSIALRIAIRNRQ